MLLCASAGMRSIVVIAKYLLRGASAHRTPPIYWLKTVVVMVAWICGTKAEVFTVSQIRRAALCAKDSSSPTSGRAKALPAKFCI